MTFKYDYLIVGAGIAGAAAGYELAKYGRVALLERESRPGYHSTGRSAATFSETYGTMLTRSLAAASRSFLSQPPGGFTDVPLLHRRGVLLIARSDQAELLDRHEAAAAKSGGVVERLDASAVDRRMPALRPGYAVGGIYEADAMDIDVAALHQGYLRGIRRSDGRIVTDAEVVELCRTGELWHAQTSQGTFCAPVLINAAGAWADELAKLAGVQPIGLQPLRRTVVTFDVPNHGAVGAWPMVGDAGAEFYFRPDAGRILASPADQTPSLPCDAQPELMDIAILMERIERATIFSPQHLAAKWAGLRSFVADKEIVAGFDPSAPGFYWLAGQGGTGVMTSVAMGRIVASQVTNRPLHPEVARREIALGLLAPHRGKAAS